MRSVKAASRRCRHITGYSTRLAMSRLLEYGKEIHKKMIVEVQETNHHASALCRYLYLFTHFLISRLAIGVGEESLEHEKARANLLGERAMAEAVG